MKVSRKWLQNLFDAPLPDAAALADALTFHAFEIEEASVDLLDVKVLPNRAADCLCHRGIAKELSAILNIPLKSDPLREALQGSTSIPHYKVEPCNALQVEIEDPKKCLRYMGALMKGVKVGPSPVWLKEALEAVGQRSINNIVDATNYVMLDIGQPLHAFDAGKLAQKDGMYGIEVRNAKEGETMTTLSGEEFTLPASVLLITDANADAAIGLAGLKGGKIAEVTASTTDIIVEAANFDGTTIRRASQALKLATDASLRFQNRPSPELAAYGMRAVLALIKELAGGEAVAVVDSYPSRAERGMSVGVSLEKINSVLGSSITKEEVENVFKRLGLPAVCESQTFTVTPPFERTDILIPEDLIEEVGRIIGYDRVPAAKLPPASQESERARYRGIEKVRDELVAQGFTEISTQSFAAKGDIVLVNPLDKAKPALRASLDKNMQEALAQATYVAPLVLAPREKPKLFEIGTIFTKEGERLEVKTSEPVSGLSEITDNARYEPVRYELGAFKLFSVYPFIVRDVALWVPTGTEVGHIENAIRKSAGKLLVRVNLFDRFEKNGKTSLAFRLVFQSVERTLTDEEVNNIMEEVATKTLRAAGYEVR